MFEKRFAAVPVQSFTADGGSDGTVTIADTSLFKVKQQVIVAATGLTNLDQLEVKNVVSPTKLIVGPQTGSLKTFTNISAYTLLLSGNIFADEQIRPKIIADAFERATYEEEPTVAKRTILVDKYGNKVDTSNPLPVTIDGIISIPPLIPERSTLGSPVGITVSTAAVLLAASNASRKNLLITNNSTTNIFLGHTNAVTISGATMGIKLVPGGSYGDSGNDCFIGDIYAIGDAISASQNVSVWERT